MVWDWLELDDQINTFNFQDDEGKDTTMKNMMKDPRDEKEFWLNESGRSSMILYTIRNHGIP